MLTKSLAVCARPPNSARMPCRKMPVQPLADRRGRSVTMAAGPHASSSPAISWSDIGDFGQVRSHPELTRAGWPLPSSLPHSTPRRKATHNPPPPGTPGTPNTAWLVPPYPLVARPALLLHSLAAAVARWTLFFFFCFLPLDAPPPMWLFPPSLRPHHPSRPHTSLLALPSARTPLAP